MIILGMPSLNDAVKITRFESAADFLQASEDLRGRDPFRTNLIGSVALSVANGTRKYDQTFWWTIADSQGIVQSIAMRTAPHNLTLTPMSLAQAARLAEVVAEVDPDMPGVSGSAETVDFFVSRWNSLAGTQLALNSQELIYNLPSLKIFYVNGELRPATSSDLPLIIEWTKNFAIDTGLEMPQLESSVQNSIEEGRSYLWIYNGMPVSLAGHAPLVQTPTGTVGRIGPVYTPPEFRQRGFAGSITSALSEKLIRQGIFVMLYTAAENETSNGVYKRLGFQLLDQNNSYLVIR